VQAESQTFGPAEYLQRTNHRILRFTAVGSSSLDAYPLPNRTDPDRK
jgi:hypothetical protein